MSDPSPIDLHVHPPERRRRQTVTLPCGCCCCCCCLHSIGSLIGAAVGSSMASVKTKHPPVPQYLYEDRPEEDLIPPLQRSSALSPAALYWIILAMLVNLTLVISCVGFGGEPLPDRPFEGLGPAILILAIFLPGVQLAASVITMILAGLTDRANAAARIWAVGKITLGTLIGTGVGLGIMFLIYIGSR